jgi:hypothetical protein
MKKGIVLLTCILLLTSCSRVPSADVVATSVAGTVAAQQPILQEQVASPMAQKPINTTAPTLPPESTATLEPTTTQAPTSVPLSTYTGPVVLAEISGTGSVVTDDYQLPRCWKAVFYWNALPDSSGYVPINIDLYNKASPDDSISLVDVYGMDIPAEGMSGAMWQGLKGGTYYFATSDTNDPWTVKIVCLDNVAPTGTAMDIKGKGQFVSDSYELPACNKSVFSWSVEPDRSGYAFLSLYLCDQTECNSLVSEYQSDMTGPLTGQVVQRVDKGTYFIFSDGTQQSWSVTWECKD